MSVTPFWLPQEKKDNSDTEQALKKKKETEASALKKYFNIFLSLKE